jgi:hypothetical protein
VFFARTNVFFAKHAKGRSMKRVWLLVAVLSLSVFALGCPGGGEEAVEGSGEVPAATTEAGSETTGPSKQFKEGIESGRAEDGSDEDK